MQKLHHNWLIAAIFHAGQPRTRETASWEVGKQGPLQWKTDWRKAVSRQTQDDISELPYKRALSLRDFGDERGRRFLMLSRQARGKAVKACRRHRSAQDSMIPTHQAAGYRAVTAVELKSIGRAALINTTLMAAVPEASGAAPHHPAQQLSAACSLDVHLAIIPGENSE